MGIIPIINYGYMKKEQKIVGNGKQRNDDVVSAIRNTLDISDDHVISVNLIKRKAQIPEFIMLFQAVSLMIAKDISPSALAVFHLFLGKMQYSNHVGCDQKTIAEELYMPLPTVERAIKDLTANKIIIAYKDSQDRRRNIYIVNPNIAWKGSARARKLAMKAIDPRQLKLPYEEEKHTGIFPESISKKTFKEIVSATNTAERESE
jgi:DNA-binding MarR family transcriptional regulator